MTPGPSLPPEVRAQFPGASARIYLDMALKGLIPRAAADAAHAHVDEVLDARANKAAHLASVEHCREMLARLIGAHAGEVAITKNVFLWYNRRKLKGIEVRAVEPEDGRIPVEGFTAAVDERTRLVTVPP